MKRKVIKQGKGGLTIHLPKKWSDINNLRGGEEIDVEEKNGQLIVSSEKQEQKKKNILADITNLDRTSFSKLYTSLYESGYDEIKFVFTKKATKDYKTGKNVLFSDIIIKYTLFFEGYAIINQGSQFYTIRDISIQSEKEFDNILRRIFFLILNFNASVLNSIKQKNFISIKESQEMHDNITKFVSFCLRLLNKKISPSIEKYNLYHILISLDEVVDYNKYICRDLVELKKISPDCANLIKRIINMFEEYHNIFYDPKDSKINQWVKNWYNIRTAIGKTKLSSKELLMITRYNELLNTIGYTIKQIIALRNIKN